MTNYTPSHRETSSIGKRKLLTPDEVLRLPREDALVIFRGQKVLKVRKFDFTKHPESKKLIDCNARDYVPNWRLKKEVPMVAAVDTNTVATVEPSEKPAPKPMQAVRAQRRKPPDKGTSSTSKQSRKGGKGGKDAAVENSQLSLEDVMFAESEGSPSASQPDKPNLPDLQLSLAEIAPASLAPIMPETKIEGIDDFGHDGSHKPYGAIDIEDLLSDI